MKKTFLTLVFLFIFFNYASSVFAYHKYLNKDVSSSMTPAIIAFIGVIVGVFLQYFTSKWRAKEDREENFRLKLYEMRINAAQTAYQYTFQVYRAYARNTENSSRADKLARNARDWLDGQVLILGDEVYKSVFTYFNAASDRNSESAKLMEEAQKKLKKVLNKEPSD